MTIEHDATELFGLTGSFPRPGWVVIDAAREHRFTGELLFESTPPARVYVDRGEIYFAERSGDPSLGSRLVDAGVVNAAQLEHGSMRLGDVEHLGRLFERVPSLDRHAVIVTTELLTDECVGWLASQQVSAVEVTPYRHHPSGVHNWMRETELAPGDPLPAPAPSQEPVEVALPEPLFAPPEVFDEDVIQWAEPSWLDEPRHGARPLQPPAPDPFAPPTAAPAADPFGAPPAPPHAVPAVEPPPMAAPPAPSPLEPSAPPPRGQEPAPAPVGQRDQLSISGDWIDRLATEGLPEAGSDPLAAPRRMPARPIEPLDRFEVIWPSGEVDEQFGSTEVASVEDHHPDLDRRGPTARLDRIIDPADGHRAGGAVSVLDQPDVADELGDRAFEVRFEQPAPAVPEAPSGEAASDVVEEVDDEVVLAVRRAVASIETGALAARRRLAEPADPDPSRGFEATPPGRVAVRDDVLERNAGGMVRPAGRSVFDEVAPATELEPVAPAHDPVGGMTVPGEPLVGEPEARQGALRRLIGSLRRR